MNFELELYDTSKILGIVHEPSRYLARFYENSIQKISKIQVSWASRTEPRRYRTPLLWIIYYIPLAPRYNIITVKV